MKRTLPLLRFPAVATLAAGALLCAGCFRTDLPPASGSEEAGLDPAWTEDLSAFTTAFVTASDRHENGKGNNLTSLLELALAGSPVTPTLVLLDGDYVGGGGGGNPEFSVFDLYNEVDAAIPGRPEVLATYGSHDVNCTEGYETFFTGPVRLDGFYAYGISFAQMTYATDAEMAEALAKSKKQDAPPPKPPGGGGQPPKDRGYDGLDQDDPNGISAESGAASFLNWVSTLSDRDPIVVASHVPLHANRGDNPGALTWFDALQTAATSHDVIFLWAHNHTMEEHLHEGEESVDRGCYLLAPGDSLTLQGPKEVGTVREKIGFTYLHAGYVKLGFVTVISFTDYDRSGTYDRMCIRRFGLDPDRPETAFGDTGRPNPYNAWLRFSAGPHRVYPQRND